MSTVSISECLLVIGYLLWILTRRELKGAEWIKQKAYMENCCGYAGGGRRQHFFIKRG